MIVSAKTKFIGLNDFTNKNGVGYYTDMPNTVNYPVISSAYKRNNLYRVVFSDNTELICDENIKFLFNIGDKKVSYVLNGFNDFGSLYTKNVLVINIPNDRKDTLGYSEERLRLLGSIYGTVLLSGSTEAKDIKTFSTILSTGKLGDVYKYMKIDSKDLSWLSSIFKCVDSNLGCMNICDIGFDNDLIFRQSKKARSILLDSIFDSGSISSTEGIIEFSSGNKKLLNGVADLARSLGYFTKVFGKTRVVLYKDIQVRIKLIEPYDGYCKCVTINSAYKLFLRNYVQIY